MLAKTKKHIFGNMISGNTDQTNILVRSIAFDFSLAQIVIKISVISGMLICCCNRQYSFLVADAWWLIIAGGGHRHKLAPTMITKRNTVGTILYRPYTTCPFLSNPVTSLPHFFKIQIDLILKAELSQQKHLYLQVKWSSNNHASLQMHVMRIQHVKRMQNIWKHLHLFSMHCGQTSKKLDKTCCIVNQLVWWSVIIFCSKPELLRNYTFCTLENHGALKVPIWPLWQHCKQLVELVSLFAAAAAEKSQLFQQYNNQGDGKLVKQPKRTEQANETKILFWPRPPLPQDLSPPPSPPPANNLRKVSQEHATGS